ncbi:hypothetical protein EPUS_07508 [Endocarpon pusillum Z07020]|uniref:rRNA-processing protein EFG1 n=1 Tax=Endocarpon pusillum (strain Z07020 / HMAS-L-300199) TaxID=1263415 RepID=U1HW15_ENDPU|nr:uncharacterized protein EPUS_07508 [Endocarpon pusillum Z07020]ERF73574.1 hypothetical protein EPUS_07508 [Endocarpon pusillum Z07020]
MTHYHKLDFSGYKPSTNSSFRSDRDRSRSPERPRSDSWIPLESVEDETVRHNGRRWRGRAKPRTENVYRDRSPNTSRDAPLHATKTKNRKRGRGQRNGEETKGLSDKIHSLRRLLEKAIDMPADVRLEKERELQGYVIDQQRIKAMREKNAVTSRYHFVRFMERRKAERLVKRVERSLDRVMNGEDGNSQYAVARNETTRSHDDGTKKITDGQQVLSSAERLALQQEAYKRQLHEAKVDLNYTLYAPLNQKYISLYPRTSKSRKDQENNDRLEDVRDLQEATKDIEADLLRNDYGHKPALWYAVEKAMDNGTLEALRDGKILKADNDGDQMLTSRGMAEPGNNDRIPGIEADSDDQDQEDSEDDFFKR